MPATNLDAEYQQKALEYNQSYAGGFQLSTTGDFQSTRLAVTRGLVEGGSLGVAVGVFPAVYQRSMRPLGKYGMGAGLAYASFLGIASLYRFDI